MCNKLSLQTYLQIQQAKCPEERPEDKDKGFLESCRIVKEEWQEIFQTIRKFFKK